MAEQLKGAYVAALVDNGFEQVELTEPVKALRAAGANVEIVSPQERKVKGWQHTKWGDELDVDRPLGAAHPDDYDALLLPGGVMNPDHLRMNPKAVEFVRAFVDANQTDRGNLPRTVDADRGRRREGTADDLVAVAADRPAKRGRDLDR